MQSQTEIRLAIVDDHALIRRGIRDTLEEAGGFKVVAEGASAQDAIAIAHAHPLDIMLVDINMPGGGIEAVKAISAVNQQIKMLMLTVYDNMANVRASMQAGASGYVLKGVDGDELAAILRNIKSGAKHVSPDLAAKLLTESEDENEPGQKSKRSNARLAALSEREKQIHALIAKGSSNLEIGDKLGLREATVKHYASQIFKKLGVKNRTEAALLLT